MYQISKRNLGTAMIRANIRSAKELAQLSGISVNTLSRLNNGGAAKLQTVRALARALGCEPSELLEG